MNAIVGAVFFLLYVYQMYFVPVAILRKVKDFPDAKPLRYAILICARNEATVLGLLLDSIRDQDYPRDLVDVHVIADNCTDNTAAIAREKGAFVVERQDTSRVGKGFALEYLLNRISKDGTVWDYEGYFVIDADNLLDKHFLAEMNKAVAAGNKIVTCYRNSKNYGDNWISASYALWFLRESKFLNNVRQILGLSAQCSGTGFVIHRDIFLKYGGWRYFTLTEDIEFTFAMVTQGERIAYCPSAMLYDEQPVSFGVSWKQRTRWVKGYFQSYRRYGGKLLKRAVTRGEFSCFDMLVSTFAGAVLNLGLVTFYLAAIVYHAVAGLPLHEPLLFLLNYLASCYGGLVVVGAITTATEWRKIYCSVPKKLFYCLTFPLFLLTLLLITLCAPFSRQRWPQIRHIRNVDIDEVKKGG
jgi:cellulose synthase/poly-beta-1,6-N-acetylglucosamine synthase-like glycosyltransferase